MVHAPDMQEEPISLATVYIYSAGLLGVVVVAFCDLYVLFQPFSTTHNERSMFSQS